MYIRRKVFSLLEDEMGEMRYFSTNEFTYDGYEDRYFSDEEDEVDSHDASVAKGALIGAGIATGTAGAGYGSLYGLEKIGKKGKGARKAVNDQVVKLWEKNRLGKAGVIAAGVGIPTVGAGVGAGVNAIRNRRKRKAAEAED